MSKLRDLRWIHSVAEDMYKAYTCKDWRRYRASRSELMEMLVRLDLKAQIERHVERANERADKKEPGASPDTFWYDD